MSAYPVEWDKVFVMPRLYFALYIRIFVEIKISEFGMSLRERERVFLFVSNQRSLFGGRQMQSVFSWEMDFHADVTFAKYLNGSVRTEL